ncbi:MAG: Fur family transcriptional regulator [Oscillospiraceae bacterium]|nr:transcriptional repressor [Oscillospiraceae bacterium]HAO68774.1 transcriptional repressor [Oscillospiraceae bacterium]HCU32884.1 transcriptional repressor [Oscillospiraceae bacterium]
MGEIRSYHTKQREMVLQFFAAHPDQCFCVKDLTAQKSILVGTATLYRTLSLLCREGKLKKYTESDGSGAFYQYNDSEACHCHFHLKCLRCGQLIHMDCGFMKDMQEHIETDHGFLVDSGKSILYGLCQKCRH